MNKSRNAIQFNNHRLNIQVCIEQSYVRDSRTINHLNNNLLVNVLENEQAGKALREIHIRELERRNRDLETHQKQYTIFGQEWGWQIESIFQKIEEMDRQIEHMDQSINKISNEQKKKCTAKWILPITRKK